MEELGSGSTRRCRWAAVNAPRGVGRSPPGRLLLVALPLGHALPSLPERHRAQQDFSPPLASGRCGERRFAPQSPLVAKG